MKGSDVRERRRSLRVSQYAVAAESGVPRMHISLFENGELELTAEELRSVRKALSYFAQRRYKEIVAVRAAISAPIRVQVAP